MPTVDLAVIAIAAKYTPDTVEYLTQNKNTKAFIILSAGFSEEKVKREKFLKIELLRPLTKLGDH